MTLVLLHGFEEEQTLQATRLQVRRLSSDGMLRGRTKKRCGKLTKSREALCSPAHDGAVVHESAGEVAARGDSGDSACEGHRRKVVTHLTRVISGVVRGALQGSVRSGSCVRAGGGGGG